MKNSTGNIYRILITSILCVLSAGGLRAQSLYNEAYIADPANSREQIILFTDRSMYAVNEKIQFRSYYFKGAALQGNPWSKVLYLEIVASNGIPVAKGKYMLDEEGNSGFLSIPSNVFTGNYFLRAYTKWMRNYGPESYCYIPLRIINPFREEIQINGVGKLQQGTSMKGFNHSISCNTDKKSYSVGERATLELKLQDLSISEGVRCCLTIVPAGLADTISTGIIIGNTSSRNDFHFAHLPDLNGISISGRVINTEDELPIAGAHMHFAMLGEDPDYLGAVTDQSGLFAITLPDRTGQVEIFAAVEPVEGISHSLLIENDFASEQVLPLIAQFSLSPFEKEAATRMVINMQLSISYKNTEKNVAQVSDSVPLNPFYGNPVFSIKLDDFVNLPNMTEVIENLISGVHTGEKDGKPYLRMESMNSAISLFSPLLIVDNIPVFDIEGFLSVDPIKIEKIEVVSEVFIRGNMIYGGIINVTSRDKNKLLVKLPEESSFFDFQAWHPEEKKSIPGERQNGEREPDSRNTCLWVDDIVLQPGKSNKLHFTTAGKGEYHILVRAVSSQGQIFSKLGRIYVR